jgi:hypothetical protein
MAVSEAVSTVNQGQYLMESAKTPGSTEMCVVEDHKWSEETAVP